MRKECISCHKRKPLDAFYRTKANKVGAWCLQCDNQLGFDIEHDFNAWHPPSNVPIEVYRYKALTIELLKYLRAFEPNGCFACGKQTETKLVIDHNHRTGKVRGLLCQSCNVRLGKAKDNPPNGSALAKYINRANRTFHVQTYKHTNLNLSCNGSVSV